MTKEIFFYSLAAFFVMGAVTWLTRATPFFLFARHKEPPRLILYLGSALPPAVMAMLVVYCVKGVSLAAYPFGLPELLAGGAVVALHILKRNMLVSILGGTALYMFFVQVLF